jgi:hypothetical protein
MIAKTALGQSRMDIRLVANEVKGGDVLDFLKGTFHAGDDDTATVIATHRIHRDSHRQKENGERNRPRAIKLDYAPAVIVKT